MVGGSTVSLLIGGRANRVRRYQGSMNSSWCAMWVSGYIWMYVCHVDGVVTQEPGAKNEFQRKLTSSAAMALLKREPVLFQNKLSLRLMRLNR